MQHAQDGVQLDKQRASRGSLSVESLHQRVRCESSYVISFPTWTPVPVPRAPESQVSIAPKFDFASHIRRKTVAYGPKKVQSVQSVQSMQSVQLSQSKYLLFLILFLYPVAAIDAGCDSGLSPKRDQQIWDQRHIAPDFWFHCPPRRTVSETECSGAIWRRWHVPQLFGHLIYPCFLLR